MHDPIFLAQKSENTTQHERDHPNEKLCNYKAVWQNPYGFLCNL